MFHSSTVSLYISPVKAKNKDHENTTIQCSCIRVAFDVLLATPPAALGQQSGIAPGDEGTSVQHSHLTFPLQDHFSPLAYRSKANTALFNSAQVESNGEEKALL
jgi:hypothetical protein